LWKIKTEIMQHVLKTQKTSFLPEYKNELLKVFSNVCIHHAGLYKRLSTNVNSQTDNYQYSENPHPAHAVPLHNKTDHLCAQYHRAHVIQRKKSSNHYIAFILTPFLRA
jgi:hypothetical protein